MCVLDISNNNNSLRSSLISTSPKQCYLSGIFLFQGLFCFFSKAGIAFVCRFMSSALLGCFFLSYLSSAYVYRRSNALLASKLHVRWAISIWYCSNYTRRGDAQHPLLLRHGCTAVQQHGACLQCSSGRGVGSSCTRLWPCYWAAGKGEHVSSGRAGMKGECNVIRCLLTDSLANREAA